MLTSTLFFFESSFTNKQGRTFTIKLYWLINLLYLHMERKENLLLPSEYAKLKGISKAAVSKQMAANKLVLVLKDGRRMIKI